MTDQAFGSVEALVLAGMVEDGSPKKAFQAGIVRDDFQMYEEEWDWISEQAECGKKINWRRFQHAFPDFERVISTERLQDLCEELKQYSAYVSISAAIDEVGASINQDNALEKAESLREVIAEVLRLHAPMSDVLLTSDWKPHMEDMRRLRILRENGEPPGIPTGVKSLDHHWGGLIAGRLITVLGRPGDAKSMTLAKFMIEAFLDGRKVGMFSPEMNEFEHQCRVATLLSAKSKVQYQFGIENAFRNRALMEGHGFNEKTYKRFRQYLDGLPGEMYLFTKKWRRTKISAAFIESRVDDLGLEAIIIDPISKLKPPQKRQLKHEQIEDLVDAMADIGKSFNIPVIISNWGNRQGGNFRGSAPSKDQSFGSDAPAQEADHVVGLKHFQDENKLRMWCSKSRFGKEFTADIRFLPNVGIYDDISPIRDDYFNGSEEGHDEEIKAAVKKIKRRDTEDVEA